MGGNNHALALKIAAEHPGMQGGTIFALGAYNEKAGDYQLRMAEYDYSLNKTTLGLGRAVSTNL